MSSFGLGMIGFFRTLRMQNETPASIRLHEGAIRFGVALVVIGVIATVLVAMSHWSTVRKLRAGEMPQTTMWPLSIRSLFCLRCSRFMGCGTPLPDCVVASHKPRH